MIVREQLLGLRYFGASRSPSGDGAPQNLIQKFFRPIAHPLRRQDFGSVLREFPIHRRSFGSNRFFGRGDCPVRPLVWRYLEIEAELRAWRDHKPQSPSFPIPPLARLKPSLNKSSRLNLQNPYVAENQACSGFDRAIGQQSPWVRMPGLSRLN